MLEKWIFELIYKALAQLCDLRIRLVIILCFFDCRKMKMS